MEALYLTTRQAAQLLGVHPDSLKRMRRTGCGPIWVRLGRSKNIRYELDALNAWIRSQRLKAA